MADLTLRSVTDDDQAFLRAMLYEAAFWRPETAPRPSIEQALGSPELLVYIKGWDRKGDRGVIAIAGIEPLGAAWYRVFSETQHGYGFIDTRTPELTIAVAKPSRGKGVGRALLAILLVQARLDGIAALSLSVEDDNPAKALYEGFGFEPVEHVGNAQTMLALLSPQETHER